MDAEIAVIGGGITGLTVAWRLSESLGKKVVLLEKLDEIGGQARTFRHGDGLYDMGSHRIHPGFLKRPMRLIRDLVGEDLLTRPRRGRMRLLGRFVNYPPTPIDFLSTFGPGLVGRTCLSLAMTRLGLHRRSGLERSYEDAMIGKVGKSAYDLLYSPTARKLYGIPPTSLSPAAARVRSWHRNGLRMLVWYLLGGGESRKRNYYPRRGIGMIAQGLKDGLRSRGGILVTHARPMQIQTAPEGAVEISYGQDGESGSVRAKRLVSTIAHPELLAMLRPRPPSAVMRNAANLWWRALRLLYLTLNKPGCGQTDTYYFPETEYVFGRISERKRFSPALMDVEGQTALCIEIPCTAGDQLWRASTPALVDLIERDLLKLSFIEDRSQIVRSFSRRLQYVYPIYAINWEKHLQLVSKWLAADGSMFAVGRSALFLHSNIDHCIEMGLECADVLLQGGGSEQWLEHASEFRDFHVRD